MQNGVLIPFSSEVVSLGVTLDSKLTWKPHVDQVTKKVNKALYTLRFIRRQPCTTSLRLLHGGILRRNERSADQTGSIEQYRSKIHVRG